MSNSFKIKKSKKKKVEVDNVKDKSNAMSKAKFMKGKKEKGTSGGSFSGKSSKEFSRKKT